MGNINASDLNNLDSQLSSEKQNRQGIEDIWGNPNAGSTSCSRTQSYSGSQRSAKFTGGGVSTLDIATGGEINASDTNNHISSLNAVTDSSPCAYDYSGTVSSGAEIDDSTINGMQSTLNNIISCLNTYDSWFSSDKCNRSCQLSCQTSCQTSCQGCNTSQCHNQKCGIH